VTVTQLPFSTRLWFAWACFFKVLFDGAFAARAFRVRFEGELPAPSPEALPEKAATKAAPSAQPLVSDDGALKLLSLLQREGRLVDFLKQDITSFADADIGAAARVVHEGCRKVLSSHVEIAPIRNEAEGSRTSLAAGFDPDAIKLTGNVVGSGPYTGTLRHKGWRVQKLTLPSVLPGHDAHVLAPAEVEL
jgi:hypothetical protein